MRLKTHRNVDSQGVHILWTKMEMWMWSFKMGCDFWKNRGTKLSDYPGWLSSSHQDTNLYIAFLKYLMSSEGPKYSSENFHLPWLHILYNYFKQGCCQAMIIILNKMKANKKSHCFTPTFLFGSLKSCTFNDWTANRVFVWSQHYFWMSIKCPVTKSGKQSPVIFKTAHSYKSDPDIKMWT